MSKRYRWVCPSCNKAALGSSRPPLDSIVRYCLPCSKKQGRLVVRASPVLERRRAKAKAKLAAQRKQRGKARLAADRERWVVGRFDLRAEAKRLCKLAGIKLPKLERRWRNRGGHTSGRSWGGRVVLTMPRDVTEHDALALLCHELAHEGSELGESHGVRWRGLFVDLCRVYAPDLEIEAPDSHEELHEAMEDALELAMWKEGR